VLEGWEGKQRRSTLFQFSDFPHHLPDTPNGVCNANSTKVQATTKAKEEIVVVIVFVAAFEPNSARSH